MGDEECGKRCPSGEGGEGEVKRLCSAEKLPTTKPEPGAVAILSSAAPFPEAGISPSGNGASE